MDLVGLDAQLTCYALWGSNGVGEVEMPQLKQVGKIVRVTDQGLAYLSTGSGSERRDFPFTFDKIRSYRGQGAREIGLRKGVEVRFSEKDGRVESVEIG